MVVSPLGPKVLQIFAKFRFTIGTFSWPFLLSRTRQSFADSFPESFGPLLVNTIDIDCTGRKVAMTKGTGAKKVNAKKVAKAVEDKTFGT